MADATAEGIRKLRGNGNARLRLTRGRREIAWLVFTVKLRRAGKTSGDKPSDSEESLSKHRENKRKNTEIVKRDSGGNKNRRNGLNTRDDGHENCQDDTLYNQKKEGSQKREPAKLAKLKPYKATGKGGMILDCLDYVRMLEEQEVLLERREIEKKPQKGAKVRSTRKKEGALASCF